MTDCILAIDNGTQSLRALIFDLSGNCLAMQKVVFDPPYFSVEPGWAEQDPQVFWDALCQACQSLWAQGIDRRRLLGMAITTQRSTVVNVDIQGRPLRPAMVWLDQRRTEGVPPIAGFWGAVLGVAGLSKVVRNVQAETEANWISRFEPEVWKKTHKYLLLSGYLHHRLTGTYVDSVGNQVGYIPFNYKRQSWATKRDFKWKLAPFHEGHFPELYTPGEVLGCVSKEASFETGLPEGLAIYAAASDKACEVLGSGVYDRHQACISYGTTASINVNSSRYLEPLAFMPAFPSAIAHQYNLEMQIYRGYWMVSWFKSEFCNHEVQLAQTLGVEVEALLDDLVDRVPAGSLGLMLQPYWTPSLGQTPVTKGAVIGFGDIHGRSHLYRSILEGVAYGIREAKERLEKKTRTPLTDVRIAGGGSRSRSAMQLTSDILGLPVTRPKVSEASGLGAAIVVALGAKCYDHPSHAIRSMVSLGETFEPIASHAHTYDRLYKEVYLKMYARLDPLYRRIQNITGYPKLPGE